MKNILLAILVSCLCVCAGSAQTGLPPFGSFQPGGFDTTNAQNLNTNFAIPISSTPGRGLGLGLSLVYDSIIYQVSGNVWSPVVDTNGNPTWGWKISSPFGSVSRQKSSTTCFDSAGDKIIGGNVHWTNYVLTDSAGTRHVFPVSVNDPTLCDGTVNGTYTGYATDNSGYYIVLNPNGPDNPTVFSPGGLKMSGLGDVNQITDPNGNFVTRSVVGNTTTWADTLNRTAIKIIDNRGSTPANVTYQFLAENGGALTVQVNYSSYNIQTNFVCGITEYAASNVLLPSSVVFLAGDPHSKTYSFTYESTPGFPGKITGRLTQITLPSGGHYQYQYPTTTGLGVSCSDGSYTSLTKVIDDGLSTSGTWTFSRNVSLSQTTVTPPSVAPAIGASQLYTFNSSARQTTVVYRKDASNTSLKTVVTAYASNGTPSSVTTTMNDTNQKSQTAITYDSNGLLQSTSEYDFGSGAIGSLVRTTTLTYQGGTQYTANNLINRVNQKLVKDAGGNIVARTDFNYDEYSKFPLSLVTGATHHDDTNYGTAFTSRGNLTSSVAYSDAANAAGAVTTTYSYNTLGNLIGSKDNNGNPTTYTYVDAWATAACAPTSGLAYVTSATNALGQSTTAKFNSCTGTLASVTDLNSQVMSFSYDNYRRQTITALPNGGAVTNIFTDGVNPSVETDTKMTSSVNLVSTVYYDGLGRTKSTTHNDPAGVDSSDTVYDQLGRISSVTNGHRASTADTDGATSYLYDALGRPVSITEQDGSVAQLSYNGNQVTKNDEAGNQTKVTTDALGRTTSVWETDPSTGSGFLYETDYQFDLLDDLRQVDQKGNTTDSAQLADPHLYI